MNLINAKPYQAKTIIRHPIWYGPHGKPQDVSKYFYPLWFYPNAFLGTPIVMFVMFLFSIVMLFVMFLSSIVMFVMFLSFVLIYCQTHNHVCLVMYRDSYFEIPNISCKWDDNFSHTIIFAWHILKFICFETSSISCAEVYWGEGTNVFGNIGSRSKEEANFGYREQEPNGWTSVGKFDGVEFRIMLLNFTYPNIFKHFKFMGFFPQKATWKKKKKFLIQMERSSQLSPCNTSENNPNNLNGTYNH